MSMGRETPMATRPLFTTSPNGDAYSTTHNNAAHPAPGFEVALQGVENAQESMCFRPD